MNNLKILSWNICWGCMTADDTSHLDTTAQVLAEKCARTQVCLTNVAKLIDNDEYDIIGLQEATKYNDIILKSKNLQEMGCVHHALYIKGNTIDLTTFYNKQKFKAARDIKIWLKKYIKYKTKYLELKNQLGK